jgi:hypothetical protein
MKNPEFTPERPSLVLMYDEADRLMQEQGVDPSTLDPAVAVLAIYDNKDVLRSARQVINNGYVREHVKGQKPTEQDEENIGHAQRIEGVQSKLARPARRRLTVRGLAIAALTGTALLTLVGNTKYEIRDSMGSDVPAAEEPDTILRNNTLIYDSGILSGDTGKDIPVIGPVLGMIPGIPDYDDLRGEYETYTEDVVVREKVTESLGYEDEAVANPIAPDLELTGVEYEQARETANKLFDKLGSDFSIGSVIVTGSVSDDFGGELGVLNSEQQKLADARALVAAQAFGDVAQERGVKLVEDPAIIGVEQIVNPEVLLQISREASISGFDTSEVIRMYNNGEALPEHIKGLLHGAIGGSNRGATFSVSGTRARVEKVQKVEWVESTEERTFDDIPGEGVFVFGALPGLIYGGVFWMGRPMVQQTRRRARRIAKKAGLQI